MNVERVALWCSNCLLTKMYKSLMLHTLKQKCKLKIRSREHVMDYKQNIQYINKWNKMQQIPWIIFFLTEQVTVTITVFLWINVWVTTPLLINPPIIFLIFSCFESSSFFRCLSREQLHPKDTFPHFNICLKLKYLTKKKQMSKQLIRTIVRKYWKVPVNILQGLMRPFQTDQQSRNTKIISLISCMTKKNSKSSAEDVWSSFDWRLKTEYFLLVGVLSFRRCSLVIIRTLSLTGSGVCHVTVWHTHTHTQLSLTHLNVVCMNEWTPDECVCLSHFLFLFFFWMSTRALYLNLSYFFLLLFFLRYIICCYGRVYFMCIQKSVVQPK